MMDNFKGKEDVLQIVNQQFDLISSQDDDLRSTETLVKDAVSNAKRAKEKVVRWYSRSTPTIECLQDSVVSQANALECLCKNQIDIYEKMQKLSATMQELFLLGVMNSSYINAIIEQLQKKSNQANLTETAKQQLLGIIKSLEHHATIQNKIDRLKEKISNLKVDIKQTESRLDLQLSEIKEDLQTMRLTVESQNNIIQSLKKVKITDDLMTELKNLKDLFEDKIVYANSQEKRIKLYSIITITSIIIAITSFF